MRVEGRAVVGGAGRERLVARLEAVGGGPRAGGVARGSARDGRTAFMFTGQGAQRAGMGSELYDTFPVFRDAFDAVCAELDKRLGRSVKELVFDTDSTLLDRTDYTQPGLFAVEVALYRLVESWGVEPDYLIGHSVGELVAAHLSGVLSLSDACELVVARGRLMGALPEGGAMFALQATEEEARESLGGFEDKVSIAAVNGPRAMVISGDEEAIDQLEELWGERG